MFIFLVVCESGFGGGLCVVVVACALLKRGYDQVVGDEAFLVSML